MKKIILITFIFPFYFSLLAQDVIPQTQGLLSTELTLNNLISGGFNASLFIKTSTHWSFGLGLGNGPIEGIAKELVFESIDLDALEIDLPFIVGLTVRYFFNQKYSGFYSQLSVGNEIFRIRNQALEQTIHNQFAVITIGFLWKFKPNKPTGLYLHPNIGANFTWNSKGERLINEISYELKSFFPNPNLVLGWRF